MKMPEYRKLVARSVDTKSAKIGLKQTTKSNKATNLALGVSGLRMSVGNVIANMTPYLLGTPFDGQQKQIVFESMSGLSADIVFLAKLLKVKLPALSKKVKSPGSRTENLLKLQSISDGIMAAFSTYTFAPSMEIVEKEVVLPSEGGKKEMRAVSQLDKALDAVTRGAMEEAIAAYLSELITTYWHLSNDMFQMPPQALIDANADNNLSQFAEAPPVVEAPVVVEKKSKAKSKAA